jgi:hypothetical protein
MEHTNNIVHLTINLKNLNIPEKYFLKLLKASDTYFVEKEKIWSNHLRDMTKGWTRINSVSQWSSKDGPYRPGTYALVFDPYLEANDPITWADTLIFGETTQDAWKRIYSHVAALHGKTSNMSDKWAKNIPKINRFYDCDICKELANISIFFRPHELTDDDWKLDRNFSAMMERQAHAQHRALHGKFTLCNSRDIPDNYLIEESKRFLKDKGFLLKPSIFESIYETMQNK